MPCEISSSPFFAADFEFSTFIFAFLELFEKENPEATQATFQKGTILDKITDDKDTIPQDKGYLSELVLSLKQGKRGLTTDGAFDLMRHGKNITDEKLQEWVRDVEKYGGVPQTQAQIEYSARSNRWKMYNHWYYHIDFVGLQNKVCNVVRILIFLHIPLNSNHTFVSRTKN